MERDELDDMEGGDAGDVLSGEGEERGRGRAGGEEEGRGGDCSLCLASLYDISQGK